MQQNLQKYFHNIFQNNNIGFHLLALRTTCQRRVLFFFFFWFLLLYAIYYCWFCCKTIEMKHRAQLNKKHHNNIHRIHQ